MTRKVRTPPPKLSALLSPDPAPVVVDVSTLPLCEDAEAFVQWADSILPDLLTPVSVDTLDKAMLAIAKEYLYRRRTAPSHPHNTCLIDVFHERLDQLLEQQLEIARHKFLEPPPPPPKETRATLVPALYIGTGDGA